MKKIVLASLFCFCAAGINAQDKLDTLVNQFCACLNEKVAEQEKTNNKNSINLKEVAVACMMPAFVNNLSLL